MANRPTARAARPRTALRCNRRDERSRPNVARRATCIRAGLPPCAVGKPTRAVARRHIDYSSTYIVHRILQILGRRFEPRPLERVSSPAAGFGTGRGKYGGRTASATRSEQFLV